MQPALFLDRDGVINIDHGYVGSVEQFEIVPGIVDVLKAAQERGYLLIVITNQSGIARGYFTAEDYLAVERHMKERFSEQGVSFTAVYHCPHHPDGTVPQLAVDCSCRKPMPGLILKAASEHHVDLAHSILVGDKPSDVAAGLAAGVGKTILFDHRKPMPFAELGNIL